MGKYHTRNQFENITNTNKCIASTCHGVVGQCPNGCYGFGSPCSTDLLRYKYHSPERGTSWGKSFNHGNVGFIGVALDLLKGEVLFSVDGQWTAPMGVAFTGVNNDEKFFPAIDGSDCNIEVNFGQREFTHGPPDGSFNKFNAVV